jgi:peptidoglycan/xylan/chitin deacetylase (PgdA/CDA1 family)
MVEEGERGNLRGKRGAFFPSRMAVLDLPPSMEKGGEPSGDETSESLPDPKVRGYGGMCRSLVREKAFSKGRRGRTLIRRTVSRLFSRPSSPPGTLRILMYHRVADTNDRDILTVTPFSFAQQMMWLREEGWKVLPVREALLKLESGSLPPRAAVITFDDGYRDNFDEAYPILLHCGFPATVFPVTGFVLGESEHRRYRGARPSVPYLSVEQIREMKANGIDFGGHTHTHPLLSSLSIEAATEEISRAKKLLEEWTGEKSTLFAYPNGVYSRDHFRILDGLGYEAAFSVHPGANRAGTLRWILRRTEVSGRDSLGDFIHKMNGGLDLWHGLYQGVRGFYR